MCSLISNRLFSVLQNRLFSDRGVAFSLHTPTSAYIYTLLDVRPGGHGTVYIT
jgi:hypothetical protein